MTADKTALRRISTCRGVTSCSWPGPEPRPWSSRSVPSMSVEPGWRGCSACCALIGASATSAAERVSSWGGSLLSLEGGDDLVEVIGLDEDVTGLGAFAGTDHA